MASFTICPVIDRKSFLEITDDSVPGCITVALNKKMIIRFRLSDQRQLGSWATKDKLRTPVFFDHERMEYFAVYNGDKMSRWSPKANQIGKIVGTLQSIVHSMHVLPGIPPVVLFNDGSIGFLSSDKRKVTDLRREPVPFGPLKVKAFSFGGKHYLTYFHEDEGIPPSLNFSPISESADGSFSMPASRKDCDATLSSYTVLEEKGHLMTLWSDGGLYSLDLNEPYFKAEDFPGRSIMTFTTINCSLPCEMLSITDGIAVYGADAGREGAKIIWVESNFGVVQNTLHLKLYSNPPRLWKVGSSYLITVVGHDITVIPYKLKNVPKLDTLLAAHRTSQSHFHKVTWQKRDTRKWSDDKNENTLSQYLENEERLNEQLERGCAKKALATMNKLMDVPDKCIINAIVCCLRTKADTELLLQFMMLPMLNDSETLSYVRDKLDLNSTLAVVRTVTEELTNYTDSEALLKWIILLLDSHYQQLLQTKDPDMVELLTSLKQKIDGLVENMFQLQQLYKLLTGALKTNVTTKSTVHYSVDKFQLY